MGARQWVGGARSVSLVNGCEREGGYGGWWMTSLGSFLFLEREGTWGREILFLMCTGEWGGSMVFWCLLRECGKMIFDPFLFFCFFGLPLQNSFPFIFGSTFTQFILEFLWLNMVNRCRVSCVCPVLVFSYYYY